MKTFLLSLSVALLTLTIYILASYPTITVSKESLPGLHPFLQTDGLARRLTPVESPPLRTDLLEWNLMQVYRYRNTNSLSVPVDNVS